MGHSAVWELQRRAVIERQVLHEVGHRNDEALFCRHCGWEEAVHRDPLATDNRKGQFSHSLDDCPGFEEE